MKLLSVNVGRPRPNPWKRLGATGLIGERWQIGLDVVLEVSCPRIPCATFQGWLAREGWIKRFTEAARPGAFLRVYLGVSA